MKRILLSTFFAVLVSCLFAQEVHYFNIPKVQKISPLEIEDDFAPSLFNTEAPFPGSYRYFLEKQKQAQLNRNFNNSNTLKQQTPANNDTLEIGIELPVAKWVRHPTTGDTIAINHIAGGRPNDNTLAISNDNIIVASFNSSIFTYDLVKDSVVFDVKSLHSFSSEFTLNDKYDPKVKYDPINDRFILLFLNGRLSNENQIIVAFSSTNNPADDWNLYALPGNPLNDATWSDYPAMAITKNDLFVTVNQLKDNEPWQTGFTQSLIWQVALDSGYVGGSSLKTKLWSDIDYNGAQIRNLHPAQGGSEPTDSLVYLLSNRNFALENDSIFLLKIEGTAYNDNVVLEKSLLYSDINYGLAPNAAQMGHPDSLATNDSRVLGAFLENNKLHFVGNSIDFNTGKPSVYHGIINDIDNPEIKGTILSDDTLEFGYPNIVYAGNGIEDHSAIISFNHSSEYDFPGNSAIYYKSNHSFSPLNILKEGETYTNRINGYERWGDYYGIQRKYNEPGVVWTSGFYGKSNSNHTWISEIKTKYDETINVKSQETNKPSLNLYPNPTQNIATTEFHLENNEEIIVSILNIEGKLIKTIYRDLAKAGNNQFSFSTTPLSKGIYFLEVKTSTKTIRNKFIKM